jgi:hypothetical protein
MVTGIVGWLIAPLLLLTCAIVFGGIGLSKSGPHKEYKGGGMATAGLVLGILGWVIIGILVAAIV